MAKPSDYSPGGQVYDRTTGTWAGENTGNVGDDRSAPGRGTFVIHDANGPVGVHLAPARQVAAGAVATAVGGGGSGPGSAAVGATVPGPGSSGTMGAGPGPGGAGVAAGPLKPKMKPTGTQLLYGGNPVMPHPGFSDMDEVEQRLGDGDSPLDPAWYYKWSTWAADTYHNNVELVPKQTQFQPGGGSWLTRGVGDWWTAANSPFGPDHPIAGFDSGGF